MLVDQDKLKEFIVDSGLVSEKLVEEAMANTEDQEFQSFADYLIERELISEEDVKRVEAYLLGVPFIDISTQQIPVETLKLIPEPIARNLNVIAYAKNGHDLEIAMTNTDDLGAIDFIKKKTGLRILPRLTSGEAIKRALTQYQQSLKADFSEIIKRETGQLKSVDESDGDQTSEEDLKRIAEDVPVIHVVDTLLKHAIIQNSSDIHIEPTEQELLIRYRIDGILHDAMTLPKKSATSITARIKVLASLKLDEKRLPQDGRFKIELDGEKVSFRVSVLPTYYGEKTVMRVLREGGGNFTLESLGFHGNGFDRIEHAMQQKTGMILTTGPTGSGKSTSLYTLLSILNTPDVNVSTVEDPVEYQMKRVNQTQVRPDIGFTFALGLRTLVRQDPDIIMVGEIRDHETAELATDAALTGHLVLSTLHTNSAAGTVARLIEMGIPAFLLVSTLKVIIGQRLVRKLGNQKERYTLNEQALATLKKSVDLDRVMYFLKQEKVVDQNAKWEDIPFYRPLKSGDDNSSTSGYKGRMGIYEVLTLSDKLREMVIEGASTQELNKQAKKEGMMSMIEDGIFKAVQGSTTIEEVLRVVSE